MGSCNSFCLGNSCASSRQQDISIEQLREPQNKQSSKSNASRHNVQKIVPMTLSVTSSALSAQNKTDDLKKEAKQKSIYVQRKELERAKRNLKEENNLKFALTHPTILKFLKAFMIAQSADNMLDFYLDVAEIRGLNRSRHFKGHLLSSERIFHDRVLSLFRQLFLLVDDCLSPFFVTTLDCNYLLQK